jgi:hypothetical protein
MGHERVGVLPRTREWRALVHQIAATADTPETVPAVATATLLKVRQRFDRIPSHPGFQAAFGFILGLATSQPETGAVEDVAPRLNLSSEPSPLRLTAQMQSWVDAHADSLEYADLAKRAAADVIAFWTRERTKRAKPGARVDRAKLRQIDLHWHDLRHEGACRLLAEHVDIRTIQPMLGHADIKQTQRYLNITDEELRKAMTGVWERRRQLNAVGQSG